MPISPNPYGGSVVLALHLRKSRSSSCRCCIRPVPISTQEGTSTTASRRRFVGRFACSENNISLHEPAFRGWRKGSLSDRESQAKRRHRMFPQRGGIVSPNRSNG